MIEITKTSLTHTHTYSLRHTHSLTHILAHSLTSLDVLDGERARLCSRVLQQRELAFGKAEHHRAVLGAPREQGEAVHAA
jgi:hypothetical protein